LGSLLDERNVTRSWDRLRRRARKHNVRPPRLHDARHTFASLALTAGKSIPWVSGQPGHATPEITLRVYAHALHDDEPCFSNRQERPAVQTAVPEDRVERLVVPVLPRTSRLDELRVDASLCEPLLNVLSNQLGSVVALDDPGFPAALDELTENTNDIVRVQEPARLDPERLPCELVDHRQEAEPLPVDRLARHEVVGPDVVRIQRPILPGGALARPAPFSLLPGHLEALSLPNQREPISPDREALRPQLRVDLPVSEPRILLRELVDSTNEPRFLDPA
jgi:hypothetical protein